MSDPQSYITFVESTDKPGAVLIQCYVDRIRVFSRSMDWRMANNLIGEIHAACTNAERLGREAGR